MAALESHCQYLMMVDDKGENQGKRTKAQSFISS
jgi:hypothetical protein